MPGDLLAVYSQTSNMGVNSDLYDLGSGLPFACFIDASVDKGLDCLKLTAEQACYLWYQAKRFKLSGDAAYGTDFCQIRKIFDDASQAPYTPDGQTLFTPFGYFAPPLDTGTNYLFLDQLCDITTVNPPPLGFFGLRAEVFTDGAGFYYPQFAVTEFTLDPTNTFYTRYGNLGNFVDPVPIVGHLTLLAKNGRQLAYCNLRSDQVDPDTGDPLPGGDLTIQVDQEW